jgi:hypothetical protein
MRGRLHFIELNQLFDKAAEEIEEFIDGSAPVHPLLVGFVAWRERNKSAESQVILLRRPCVSKF